MKTQVIQLDPHDDVLSIRDKLGWGSVGRVLLVWPTPRRATIPTSLPQTRLDLALLQHTSRRLGLQLAIVSADAEVRFNAQALGIPAFETTVQAQTERWRGARRRGWWRSRRTPRPIEPPPPVRRSAPGVWRTLGRGAAFLLAGCAFVALALLLVPEAHVSLAAAEQTQEVVIPVQASPANTAVTLAGDLPARTQSIIVETQGVLTSTGTILVPATLATGAVRFTNLTDRSVTVPQDTIVCSEDQSACFSVNRAGEVRPGPGATLTLPVTALKPGILGNTEAQSVTNIQGALSFLLSVENPQAMRGGGDLTMPAPSPDDRIKLYNQALAALRQEALSQIQAGLATGDVLASTPVLTQTIAKEYDPPLAEPADQLRLTLRLQFEAHIVLAADLQQLAELVLDARLPEGYQVVSGTLAVEGLEPPVWKDEAAQWRIHARRVIQAPYSGAEVAAAIRGLTPPEALEAISERVLAGPARIELSPAWWPRLPWVAFRITVEAP